MRLGTEFFGAHEGKVPVSPLTREDPRSRVTLDRAPAAEQKSKSAGGAPLTKTIDVLLRVAPVPERLISPFDPSFEMSIASSFVRATVGVLHFASPPISGRGTSDALAMASVVELAGA